MGGAERIVAEARTELETRLRERVRHRLREQPVEWLVEELLGLLLPDGPDTARGNGHAPPAVPAQAGPAMAGPAAPAPGDDEVDRAARAIRVRTLGLKGDDLPSFNERYRALDRATLEREGLLRNPPAKGGPLIEPRFRSPEGEALLREAKDVLYALLFGGEEEDVRIERVGRELLMLTVPQAKLHAIAFVMRAATEIGAQGARRDPHGAADTLLQVEYGEAADEMVGRTIAACLRLINELEINELEINELEINEQVLYGRRENVEESTR